MNQREKHNRIQSKQVGSGKYSIFSCMVPDLTPEETAAKTKTFGYDGIEWGIDKDLSITFEQAIRDAEHYKRISDDNGLEIVALGTGLVTNELEKINKMFDVSARMNCPQFRIWAPWYGFTREEMQKNNYNRLFSQAQKDLEPIEKLAQKYGITVTIEIHFGNICPSVGLTHRLVSSFDPRYIGVVYDPPNMIIEGRESWKMGLELLGDYLALVHLKNVIWRYGDRDHLERPCEFGWHWAWAELDKGMVDWAEIIQLLRSFGYNGYLSLEDFSARPVDEKMKIIDYLRGL